MVLTPPLTGDRYTVHRMLPPGPCRYFFSGNGDPTPLVAKDQPTSTDLTNLVVRRFYSSEVSLNAVSVKPAKTFLGVSGR
jgi:hypothetical protein